MCARIMYVTILIGFMCGGCTESEDSIDIVHVDVERTTDLVVQVNELLEIAENTSFINGASLYLSAGSGIVFSNDVQLSIDGNLIATGSSSSAVGISSSNSIHQGGIRVNGDSLVLEHTRVSNLNMGVIAEGCFAILNGITVSGCESGLWLDDANGTVSDVSISACDFGLRISESSVVMSQLDVQSNNTGVSLDHNFSEINASYFSENIIAIRCIGMDSTLILDSDFLTNDKSVEFHYAYPVFRGNRCRGSRIDLYLLTYSRRNVHIEQNDFLSAEQYSVCIPHLEWDNSHAVDISGNYWGTTDEEEIATRIRDGFDDELCDTLVFAPIAISPLTNF